MGVFAELDSVASAHLPARHHSKLFLPSSFLHTSLCACLHICPTWPHSDPLHVTLTPKKLKTGIGSTVILSCALTGSPEFTIRWYRNTELVLPGEAISIRGLSNETLLISSAQKSHSGAYQCFATRKAQTAQDFAIIVLEGE